MISHSVPDHNYIKVETQTTADGSPTLYRADIDEHYHSVKGALAESRHVYIESGVCFHLDKGTPQHLRVLEIGFGTGLNAALTMQLADMMDIDVSYHSLELYPLVREQWEGVDFGQQLRDDLIAVNSAPWNENVKLSPCFTIQKHLADFCSCELPQQVDVVYFDAFAPEKQPEMWQRELFERLFAAMNPGGVLTTYCAKGVVRRMLADLGFDVHRIPGPPGGKREILRCIVPSHPHRHG